MSELPIFQNVEECVAHFLVSPPDGEDIDIELETDLVDLLKERATKLECSPEILLSAILTVDYQKQHQSA